MKQRGNRNNRTKINNGLIVMNKGERIAVISLLVIIAILMAFNVFRPALRLSDEEMRAFHNLDSLIALQEEAARQEQARQALAASEQAVPPAKTTSSTTTVHSNSEKNSSASSRSPSTTLQTTVNPATSSSSPSNTFSNSSKKIPILELNATDSIALIDLPQIGEVMASRIQRYRDRLGGFVCFEQLYEVKGMDSARFATVRPYLQLDPSAIHRLEVNRDDFKTLLRHPYLEYEQVKAIVNHRERKGLIRNWEQLQGIVGEVNPLLEQYISY
jgi:DNA uptake protein ComE-like DNA-binding protein